MSSRQERETAMRTKMLVAFATVVLAAREFVAAQEECNRYDAKRQRDERLAGVAFAKLETLLKALEKTPWARAILDDIARGPEGAPS